MKDGIIKRLSFLVEVPVLIGLVNVALSGDVGFATERTPWHEMSGTFAPTGRQSGCDAR